MSEETSLRYRFNAAKGQFFAVGPEADVRIGLVRVQKKDGTIKTEQIIKLLPPFETANGTMRSGVLAALPKGHGGFVNGKG